MMNSLKSKVPGSMGNMIYLESLWILGLASLAIARPCETCMTLFEPRKNLTENKNKKQEELKDDL